MINHFNFAKYNDKFLITNDLGKYMFLEKEEFRDLIADKLDHEDELYELLEENFFVFNGNIGEFSDKASAYIRTMKDYNFSSTALHIFAMTNNCNMNCVYCQAKTLETTFEGMMSVDTGKKAVEIALQSPTKYITFEFQGGEPLLNFDVIKAMVEHSEEINKKLNKDIEYTIVTNLIALDEEKLNYLLSHNISICTSLDGNEIVHNNNRKLRNGGNSYKLVTDKIRSLRSRGISIGAIETTTRFSLNYPKEIVDTYIEMGIGSMFVRALTPLGFAKAYWEEVGYTPQEYLKFYKKIFEYIIEINRNGENFPEMTATYFLKKILSNLSVNYMELRSPCGAGVGQMSYYYDGSVYTCDEGRMISETGDQTFRLGNVHTNTYDEMVNSPVCKTTCVASVVESLPNCCDCVYHPYCGVCPVVAYATDKDIYPTKPNDFRCQVYRGILDMLFDYLYDENDEIIDIFYRWVENY